MPATTPPRKFRFTAAVKTVLARFRNDRAGVAAVEFAIVAIPFFALVLGTIEVALIFFASQLIDSGVSEAARLIRTGQAQSQGFNATLFKQRVCANVVILSDCEATLKLDVRVYRDFTTTKTNLSSPIDASGKLIENFVFQPGVGGDIVLVRAFYEWKSIAPTMGLGPGPLANGNRLLAATAAFRNEPF